MMVRSFEFRILLVFIEMLLGQGQMNFALSIDLMFSNKLLICHMIKK